MIWSYFDAMIAYQQRAGLAQTERVPVKAPAKAVSHETATMGRRKPV